MIIFIGGLIGTGKTSLAKGVANKLNYFYYDVDAVKKEIYPTDPNYEYNLKNNIPFSDETRIKTFEKVVKDFSELSMKHKNIIVDETLHKKALRQILFDGAKKYFGRYIVVWVKVDEEIIKKRLTATERKGHILKDPFGMYLSLKKQFEDFDNVDIVFENNSSIEKSVEGLSKIIKEKTAAKDNK